MDSLKKIIKEDFIINNCINGNYNILNDIEGGKFINKCKLIEYFENKFIKYNIHKYNGRYIKELIEESYETGFVDLNDLCASHFKINQVINANKRNLFIDLYDYHHDTFFIDKYKNKLYERLHIYLINNISSLILYSFIIFINVSIIISTYNKNYVRDGYLEEVNNTIKIAKSFAILIDFNICLCLFTSFSLLDTIYSKVIFLNTYLPIFIYRKIHYISGIILYISILAHTVAHFINIYNLSKLNYNCLYYILDLNKLGFSETTANNSIDYITSYPYITGIILFILFLFHGILCIQYLKKKIRLSLFNLFHSAISIFSIIFLLFHGYRQWLDTTKNYIWTLPFIIYYIIDNRYKIFKLNKAFIVEANVYYDKFIVLSISKNLKYINDEIGVTAMVNIPAINNYEWHPFSVDVCKESNSNYIKLYIEITGKWTTELKKLVNNASIYRNSYESDLPILESLSSSSNSDKEDESGSIDSNTNMVYINNMNITNKFKIYISNYHRTTLSFIKYYPVNVIFAFGVGITPFVAIFKDYINQMKRINKHYQNIKKIKLVWVINNIDILYLFKEFFDEINNYSYLELFDINIFLTTEIPKNDKCVIDYVRNAIYIKYDYDIIFGMNHNIIKLERPNIENIIKNIIYKINLHNISKSLGVFICGSDGIEKKIKLMCYEHNYNIHNIHIHFHKA